MDALASPSIFPMSISERCFPVSRWGGMFSIMVQSRVEVGGSKIAGGIVLILVSFTCRILYLRHRRQGSLLCYYITSPVLNLNSQCEFFISETLQVFPILWDFAPGVGYHFRPDTLDFILFSIYVLLFSWIRAGVTTYLNQKHVKGDNTLILYPPSHA